MKLMVPFTDQSGPPSAIATMLKTSPSKNSLFNMSVMCRTCIMLVASIARAGYNSTVNGPSRLHLILSRPTRSLTTSTVFLGNSKEDDSLLRGDTDRVLICPLNLWYPAAVSLLFRYGKFWLLSFNLMRCDMLDWLLLNVYVRWNGSIDHTPVMMCMNRSKCWSVKGLMLCNCRTSMMTASHCASKFVMTSLYTI